MKTFRLLVFLFCLVAASVKAAPIVQSGWTTTGVPLTARTALQAAPTTNAFFYNSLSSGAFGTARFRFLQNDANTFTLFDGTTIQDILTWSAIAEGLIVSGDLTAGAITANTSITLNGDTRTAWPGAGSGILVTNGFGTNTHLYTGDNDPTPNVPALKLSPLELRSVPGGAALLMEASVPHTALTNAKFRMMTYTATNTLGDLRPLVDFNWGYNMGGNAAGVSSFGVTDTNEPYWMDAHEARWQNIQSLSQLEIWHGWGTPYTQWGTNASFRWMGANLVWDTTNKTYVQSDGNIVLDQFHFAVPFGNTLPAITFAKLETNSFRQTLQQNSQLSFAANTRTDGQLILDPDGQLLAGRYQYGMSSFGSPASAKSNGIVMMPGTALGSTSPMLLFGSTNGYAGIRWNSPSNRLEYSINAGGVATASLQWRPFNDTPVYQASYDAAASLGATAGDWTTLGFWTNSTSVGIALLEVTAISTANGDTIQRWKVPITYADQQASPSTWFEVLPDFRAGRFTTNHIGVSLDVSGSTAANAMNLRLRRVDDSSISNIKIVITAWADTPDTASVRFYRLTGLTGTGGTVSGLYRHTKLTQINGRVGIGTNSPSDTLFVAGGATVTGFTNAGTKSGVIAADANGNYALATGAGVAAAFTGSGDFLKSDGTKGSGGGYSGWETNTTAANSYLSTNRISFPAGFDAPASNSISAFAGSIDGSSAPVGSWGEDFTNTLASGSAISLANDTTANIISLSLTPGDWMVYGTAVFNPDTTTTTTYLQSAISTTSAALPTDPWDSNLIPLAVALTSVDATVIAPVRPLRITSTTTVYLVARSGFTLSTMTGYGRIYAKRVR